MAIRYRKILIVRKISHCHWWSNTNLGSGWATLHYLYVDSHNHYVTAQGIASPSPSDLPPTGKLTPWPSGLTPQLLALDLDCSPAILQTPSEALCYLSMALNAFFALHSPELENAPPAYYPYPSLQRNHWISHWQLNAATLRIRSLGVFSNTHQISSYNLSLKLQWPRLKHNGWLRLTRNRSTSSSRRFTPWLN